MSSQAKFDELAVDYDLYRPRYPDDLVDAALGPRRRHLKVVDAGAGTGISLEWVLPNLIEPEVHAIDISTGMVRAGQQKFPQAVWQVGRVEDVLFTLDSIDLIVAGQSYQWFDRKAFLKSARKALRSGGRLVVVQNNRDHAHSAFLSAYEDLLEEKSPGYSRSYRQIDIVQELSEGFDVPLEEVRTEGTVWNQRMLIGEFVGMSSSSTQAQRAVESVGSDFLTDVRRLAESYASAGRVKVVYHTELFVIEAPEKRA